MSDRKYDEWFESVTGYAPRPWQARLGADPQLRSRLVRAPTGTGKTLGVLLAWAYHRLHRRDQTWPRRLVLVLPMRVLVEQCEHEIRRVLEQIGRPTEVTHPDRVGVHVLMGGMSAEAWYTEPERDAVLLGTQDMLLSRALNRGYASPRARWPMEYGLLHHDALWVLDEVQLMGVGFATSAQLQAFRDALAEKSLRPTHSWWMSATLQPAWLHTTALTERVDTLADDAIKVPPSERHGGPFEAEKPIRIVQVARAQDPKHTEWARTALAAHQEAPSGDYGRISLVICNTVEDAAGVHRELKKLLGKTSTTELKLAHSRFRGRERKGWRESFLSRVACTKDADRIVVATQVVEAGVDISASVLVTQLAPWPALVQRFGRAARYGGRAQVTVIDRNLDEKTALPYTLPELRSAAEALGRLTHVGLSELEELEGSLETSDPELLSRLYPYEPLHVLSRRQHDELFDTDPDLTGSDLDVSRFIREGDERDVLLWWHPLDTSEANTRPPKALQPERDDLCRVGVRQAQEFLKKAAEDGAVWRWDYLEGEYQRLRRSEQRLVFPGQTFLVDAHWGGYDAETGFTGLKRSSKDALMQTQANNPILAPLTEADLEQDDDKLSQSRYRTIATHGKETSQRVQDVARALGLEDKLTRVLDLAARLHDIGKAHPVFQAAIVGDDRPACSDLAKAPSWRRPRPYSHNKAGEDRNLHRPGFRHELASTLMAFEYLARINPFHPALLGPHRALIDAGLLAAPQEGDTLRSDPLVEELANTSALEFQLATYLICAHHGKVRAGWRCTPQDQEVALHGAGREPPLRGVAQGDVVPAITVADAHASSAMPELSLDLSLARIGLSQRYGASWAERVQDLLDYHGPHTLAFLETLLRTADMRASAECNEEDQFLVARSQR